MYGLSEDKVARIENSVGGKSYTPGDKVQSHLE
jgi:hypothetical protein